MIRFTKSDEFFDSVRFVLRARETKDRRKPSFMGLYSDGENIVCSDSRRLHFAPVKLQEGLFEVIKNTAAEIILGEQIDGQFPNYKQALPDITDTVLIRARAITTKMGASTLLYRLACAGVCVCYFYIEDAIKDVVSADAYVAGAKSPVVIKTILGTAVVMPFEVRD